MDQYVPGELLTVRQHAAHFAYLTEPALRDLIFHSVPRIRRGALVPANGLAPAFHRRGRRIYVDPVMLRRLIAGGQAEAV